MGLRAIRLAVGLALLAVTGSVALAAGTAEEGHSPRIVSGDAPLVIAPGETVEDDLIVMSDGTVTVNGTLKGDLVALGPAVVINGTVEGDLIGFAEGARIQGTVLGDVRVASMDTVAVDGTVGRSLNTLSPRAVLGPQGKVGTSWLAIGGDVNLLGEVGRGVWANIDKLAVAGRVGRDLTAVDYQAVTLESTADVQGSLVARGPAEPTLQPGAGVGQVQFTPTAATDSGRDWFPIDSFAALRIVGFALLGLLLVWLAPGLGEAYSRQLSGRFWLSLGLGAALLTGVPVAAVILSITVAGLPAVLLVLLPLFTAALYVGQMLTAVWIGREILIRLRRGAPVSRFAAFALGLICLTLLVRLPVVKYVAIFVSLALALGGIVLVTVGHFRRAV